jgi:hypothetical protein
LTSFVATDTTGAVVAAGAAAAAAAAGVSAVAPATGVPVVAHATVWYSGSVGFVANGFVVRSIVLIGSGPPKRLIIPLRVSLPITPSTPSFLFPVLPILMSFYLLTFFGYPLQVVYSQTELVFVPQKLGFQMLWRFVYNHTASMTFDTSPCLFTIIIIDIALSN